MGGTYTCQAVRPAMYKGKEKIFGFSMTNQAVGDGNKKGMEQTRSTSYSTSGPWVLSHQGKPAMQLSTPYLSLTCYLLACHSA
jgi:hypothetical protein